MMEMRPGGTPSGLTARQPIPNADLERRQRDVMDRQKEEDRKRQTPAGGEGESILLPFLQEPTPRTPVQPQRIVDQTRTEPVDVLIQKSARAEPLLQPMFQQRGRGESRGRGGRGGQFQGRRGWAGRAVRRRPLSFPTPPFPTQLARTATEWASMPVPTMQRPEGFTDFLGAAMRS